MMRKKCLFIMLFCILAGSVFATDWNVDLGDWDVDANWTAGKPDGTNGYINLLRTDAVCNLDTDEGLILARWVQQNGNVLNILDGGRFGSQWARVGRGSAAYVNLSGNGTYVMYNDDLYVGLENGYCEWIMSDTSSLILDTDDGDDGEELYIAEDGGSGLLKLIGSGVTVNVDRIRLTANNPGGTATLEYVMDAGGASTIVAQRSYIGESGDAHLVLSAAADLAEEDIVLIEATLGYDIGGPGFTSMNGGAATEGTMIVLGGNVYALTYTYDANNDGENNDAALIFVKSAKFLASNPVPANGASVETSLTELSWTNPDPNDGTSPITCTVYFGKDPNRPEMQAVPLGADVSTAPISSFTDFLPLEDATWYYWIVDCSDPSANPEDGKGITYWSFLTDDNDPPLVDAGPDQVAWLGKSGTAGQEVINLDGTTSDPDGLPDPPGAYTVEWTQTGGPASVVIDPNDVDNTSVTITVAGVYEFTLTADDSEKQASDAVQIIVGEDSCDASFLDGSDYDAMDFNEDCLVGLADFADFAAAWLNCSNTQEPCY